MFGINSAPEPDPTFGLTERDWAENPEAIDHYRVLVHEAGHRAADRHVGHALLPASMMRKRSDGRHSGWEVALSQLIDRADVRALIWMAGHAADRYWIQTMVRRGIIPPDQQQAMERYAWRCAAHDRDLAQRNLSRRSCRYDSLDEAFSAATDWVRQPRNWRYLLNNTALVRARCDCAPLPARPPAERRPHPTPIPTPISTPTPASVPAPGTRISSPPPTETPVASPTPSTTPPGGTPMSGIDEIRGAIAQVTETTQGTSAQQAQISTDLEQAAGQLHQVASSSSRSEPAEALGVLSELQRQAEQAAGQLQQVAHQLEAYAASL